MQQTTFLLCNKHSSSEEKLSKYIEDEEWDRVVEIYNADIVGNDEQVQKFSKLLEEAIANIQFMWTEDELSYSDAKASLSQLKQISSEKLSEKASEELTFITIENEGNKKQQDAEKLFESGDYSGALSNLVSINQSYTQYDSVESCYEDCVELLLISISEPSSLEEYKQYLNDVDEYIEIVRDERFVEKKKLLEEEKSDFENACPLFQKSELFFGNEEYSDAFITLENGLLKYPNNRFLLEKLDELHNAYVIKVLIDTSKYIEKEDYKTALDLIEEGYETYECDEFKDAKKAIWKERNSIVRFVYNTLDYFNSVGGKWSSEDFEVKEVADNGIKYIVKSGKKLVLGDYDKNEITLLSFMGNVAVSLAGVDAGLDIRDLTYDITHLGDEEYYLVYLAADVAALIPIVGVVKYIKSVNKTGRVINKIEDLLDEGLDATKTTSKIVKKAVKSGKTEEQSRKIIKIASNHYEKIKTINMEFMGKKHPKTGVMFENKKLRYSDGKKIEGVFPKFDSFCDIKLPKELYKASFSEQTKYLNKKLAEKFKSNPNLKKRFTEEQIALIEDGYQPEEFVWHHNETEGLMQLVDREIHNSTGHSGGMSIWGKGYNKNE